MLVATRTCSRHFIDKEGQKVRKVEVLLECLPIHPIYQCNTDSETSHTTNVGLYHSDRDPKVYILKPGLTKHLSPSVYQYINKQPQS